MHRQTELLAVILGLAWGLPSDAGSQQVQQRFQSDARLDAIFARTGAVEAAYGFTVPAGLYVRSGLVAGNRGGAPRRRRPHRFHRQIQPRSIPAKQLGAVRGSWCVGAVPIEARRGLSCLPPRFSWGGGTVAGGGGIRLGAGGRGWARGAEPGLDLFSGEGISGRR